MFNRVLLDDYIEKSGLKRGFIAKKLGMSPQGFSKKMLTGGNFTGAQIKVMKELLRLTNDECEELFFS